MTIHECFVVINEKSGAVSVKEEMSYVTPVSVHVVKVTIEGHNSHVNRVKQLLETAISLTQKTISPQNIPGACL